MSRVRNARVLIRSLLLAVFAAFACSPSGSLCADKSSTKDLLSELDRFFVSSKWLEDCRRELLERDDLLRTISQLIEQGQATQQAIWLLEDLPFEGVESILRKASNSKDQFVRSAACTVLGRLGDVRGVPILEAHLARYLPKPDHRMKTIGHLEDEGAIDALEALIEIQGSASDRVLESVLGHPSPILRFVAAQGLARRGKEAVVPVLIGLLDCREQSNSSCFYRPVCQEAGRALQELTYVYDTSVYSILDSDPKMESFACEQLLRRSGQQDFTRKRLPIVEIWKASWRAWWESHKHRSRLQWREESFAWSKGAIRQEKTCDQAIEGLLLVGNKAAVDLLFALVNDPKTPPNVQVGAVQAMWFEKNPLLEEPLRQVLDHHPSFQARAAAAYALNGFRSNASGEALVRALANRETIKEAVGSLRFYPYKGFLRPLLPLLDDADAEVHSSARIAIQAIKAERSEDVLLKQLGNKPAVSDALLILDSLRWRGTDDSLPQLVALLRHDNRRVRIAAVKAIENIANVDFDYSERDGAGQKCRTAIEQWWDRRSCADRKSR